MVAQSADEAVGNANRYATCISGQCLAYTRTWLEIGSRYYSAAVAWQEANNRHHGDRTPPKGAPVFWTGGSRGYGHIALSLGNGKVRSTDVPSAGLVSTVDLSWFDSHWSAHKYVGWAEDVNETPIDWLREGGGTSPWASGDVYVEKLHKGQKDSDSVARLCYRLRHHKNMPGSHEPPKQVRTYNTEILEAVRYWQRNINGHGDADPAPGPTDGTSMSNPQANRLFGDKYHVIEK